MTSPTKNNKPKSPPCPLRRLKSWCKCVAISAVPIYATTLVLIGNTANESDTVVTSTIATMPNPLLSGSGIRDSGTISQSDRNKSLREKSSPTTSTSRQSYESIATEIAAKWNLTTPEAPYLLKQQFYRINDYNSHTDFLHFHHIFKTGGTTISDMLNATLGKLVDGHRGILPGSLRSGEFVRENFYNVTGIQQSSSSLQSNVKHDFPYLASYAHTRLRPIHGPNKTEFASFLEEYFALPNNKPRRLRELAMLREPMDLRASNQAMAMCAINGRVRDFNKKRKRQGLEPICTPEEGLNISALWDNVVDKAKAKCPNGKILPNGPKLDKYEEILCRRGMSALDICRGSAQLLASPLYDANMKSMFRALMARYSAQEEMGQYGYYGIEEYLDRKGIGFSSEKVEEYTLVDLGGLDPKNIMHTAYSGYNQKQVGINGANTTTDVEPDILWFGITERMQESTCLLYYTLNVKPLKRVPRQRVMECPPTSWWTEEQREEVKRRERADYAVWRTANAILDVRVMMMQDDVRTKLENEGKDLTKEEREQYMALVDAGCLE